MTAKAMESDKAIRYIQSLDLARSEGQWNQVPELARKVLKHAPERETLALTAKTEATAVLTPVADAPSVLRPLIAPLVDAITQPNKYSEDVFQATVCLAWLHWILLEPDQALPQLQEDPASAYAGAAGPTNRSREWVQICAVKYAYIKGFALEKAGANDDATKAYRSVLPLLSDIASTTALGSMHREFRLWAERLLSRCIAHALKMNSYEDSTDYRTLLVIFHHWAALFNFYPTDPRTGPQSLLSPTKIDFELGLEVEYSRWNMWMAYYNTLSEILKRGFVYSISYSDSNPLVFVSPADYSREEFGEARLKQRKELKNVESRIENKLLEETSFPKANVRNERVEKWADAVIDNWKVMCGPGWQDADLGEGGKNAIAKGVLDILYRAATKTFHSTQILRHLFTVHAYLAEFELALKALDAYLELFSRGKTRAEKSNEPDFSLDDHDKVLWILSEAISILCRFGRREEAEKAMELATKLRAWTEQWVAEPQIQETSTAPFNGNAEALSKPVSPTIVAIAYHALGTAEAHWARLTYEAATRTQHQNKAQEYFRLALHRRYRSSKNLDYIYSLAILMAEMRDIPGAIKIVKQALAEGDQQQTSDAEGLAQERKLIRFWHLLTLLLSARSDLLNAAKASNAAFEQFQDPGVLFGSQEYRSEHLNDASEKLRDMSPALIDQMNAFEKAGVLQVKMTQVALLEALEGPTSAIEASLDLLAIYARLFGEARDSDAPQTSATTKAPKSRVGSLRASIYKRVRSRKGDNPSLSIDVPQTATTRPQTGATLAVAPSIQVTDTSSAVGARGRTSNGSSSRRQHSLKGVRSADDNHVAQRSRSRGKIRKRSSSRKSLESFRPTSPATTYDESQAENSPSKEISEKENIRHSVYSTKAPSTAGSTMTRSTNTALPNHGNKRDSRASMDTIISHDGTVLIRQGSPAPSFPNITARRHKLSVLVDLWLFVAGMYTRSELFEDAAEAVNEAAYLVSSFEMEISRLNASAKAYSDPAWGGGKSVDELWGDIWAQRGDLAHAHSEPYEALENFEKALGYWSNHARAVVGLSELLLDIYSEKILPNVPAASISGAATKQPTPSEKTSTEAPNTPATLLSPSSPASQPALSRNPTSLSIAALSIKSVRSDMAQNGTAVASQELDSKAGDEQGTDTSRSAMASEPTPDVLNRLAARDRAYFLLSTLTKLGSGWDYSEAWFALARVYEVSGQVEKAKEVLWWCVELEDSRPLRPWSCVGLNGFLF